MSSFSPEKWNLIPVDPKFGSLIDPFGGRTVESYYKEKRFDTIRETTAVGLVELHSDKDGLNILAEEIGIGLYYENTGCLTNAGVDIFNFCDSCSDGNTEKMGGEILDEMLETMLEEKDQLLINFDFVDKNVAVVKMDKKSGLGTILGSTEDLNYSLFTLIMAHYGEYVVNLGFKMEEDVLYFGLLVTRNGDELKPSVKIFLTKILSDCNYQTFLDSPSPEKYDKLARRIFFVKE